MQQHHAGRGVFRPSAKGCSVPGRSARFHTETKGETAHGWLFAIQVGKNTPVDEGWFQEDWVLPGHTFTFTLSVTGRIPHVWVIYACIVLCIIQIYVHISLTCSNWTCQPLKAWRTTSLNYTHAEGCSKLYYLIHLESIYAGYLDQIHLDLIHGKCCLETWLNDLL